LAYLNIESGGISMVTRKFHLVSGVICLLISIILPTIIYQFSLMLIEYTALRSQGFIVNSNELNSYGLLFLLGLFWLGSFFFALRELGGYMMQLGKSESVNRHKFHQSFQHHYNASL
jgi:hypothetical protein